MDAVSKRREFDAFFDQSTPAKNRGFVSSTQKRELNDIMTSAEINNINVLVKLLQKGKMLHSWSS